MVLIRLVKVCGVYVQGDGAVLKNSKMSAWGIDQAGGKNKLTIVHDNVWSVRRYVIYYSS